MHSLQTLSGGNSLVTGMEGITGPSFVLPDVFINCLLGGVSLLCLDEFPVMRITRHHDVSLEWYAFANVFSIKTIRLAFKMALSDMMYGTLIMLVVVSSLASSGKQ